MKLSFIVPAFNEEIELPATLRALHAAAAASGEEFEIIVVDDASTDRTRELALAAGARVVSVHRRQIAAVRNAGAVAAHGDVFFFVDADTQIAPSHVQDALSALRSGVAGGSARIRLDGELPRWARLFLVVFSALYFGSNLGAGAFLFTTRDHFEAVGGFDEQYFAGEEVYLTLALRKRGRFIILPEPITTSARKIRMHSARHILWQWLCLLLGGKRILLRRERLTLWYDGRREA